MNGKQLANRIRERTRKILRQNKNSEKSTDLFLPSPLDSPAIPGTLVAKELLKKSLSPLTGLPTIMTELERSRSTLSKSNMHITDLYPLSPVEGYLIAKALNLLWDQATEIDIENKAVGGVYSAGNILLLDLMARFDAEFNENRMGDLLAIAEEAREAVVSEE